MKGFWNDADGLSLNEGVAVFLLFVWASITIWVVYLANCGDISNSMMEIYSYVADIPLYVIIALFGQGAIADVAGKSKGKLTAILDAMNKKSEEPKESEVKEGSTV